MLRSLRLRKSMEEIHPFCRGSLFPAVGRNLQVKENTLPSEDSAANGHEMPVCSVETDEKQAALTFETAWGDKDCGRSGHIKEEKISHFFFCKPDGCGTSGSGQRMKAEGRDIGMMESATENLSEQTSAEIRAELQEAEHTAKEEGISMELFRPPYGRYSDTLIRTAAEEGFFTICWSIDSRDWKNYGKRSLIKEVVESEELRNGAIIRLNSDQKMNS